MINQNLKIAIVQSGHRSYEIEREVGFWPGKLSKIITGIIAPSKDEEIALASVLGKKVCEIFQPEQVGN